MRTTTISGRLGANAEVRQTNKGTQYLQFRMASQEYGDEAPIWVNVTSFNPGDINRAKWFTQGKPVNIVGSFKPKAYTTRQGVQAAGLDIIAYSIEWVNNDRQEKDNTTTAQPKVEQTAPVASVTTTQRTANTASNGNEMRVTNGPANPFVADANDGDLPF